MGKSPKSINKKPLRKLRNPRKINGQKKMGLGPRRLAFTGLAKNAVESINEEHFDDVINNFPVLGEQIVDHIFDTLTGRSGNSEDAIADATLSQHRTTCRKGNPFPLIAFQWPEMVVTDPAEIDLFNDFPYDQADLVPKTIITTVTDPTNPVLRLDWWQKIILAAFFEPTIGEIFIKGCTGAGKGASVSIGACLWFDVYPESRTSLTGRDFTHAVKNIFGEAVSWFTKMAHKQQSRILSSAINDNERHYITILNPDPTSSTAGEAFSGAHGKNTLYLFDEACHDEQTELLSERGWLKWWEVLDSDRLLTMNPATFVPEYVKPESIHVSRRVGKMHAMQCKGVDYCVTPDHRMFASWMCHEQKQPYKLRESQNMPTRADMMRNITGWTGKDFKVCTVPALKSSRKLWPEVSFDAADWFELLGWFLSEGHVCFQKSGTASGICISQNPGSNANAIEHLLTRLKITFTSGMNGTNRKFYISSRQIAEYMLQFGRGAARKHVPQFVKEASPHLIEKFLSAYSRGDGYRRCPKNKSRTESTVIYTSSKAMADGLQEIALKAGYQCGVYLRQMAGVKSKVTTHTITSSVDGYVVKYTKINSKISYRKSLVKEIDYDGIVWCAHVPPHHLLFSRRNGKTLWSGNTSHPQSFIENAEKNARKIIALANPRTMSGAFRDAFKPLGERINSLGVVAGVLGGRLCVTVDGAYCANVRHGRLKKPVAPIGGIVIDGCEYSANERISEEHFKKVHAVVPSQIDLQQYRAICNKSDSRIVGVFAHGHFPDEDPDKQLILLSWIERHEKAYQPENPPIVECFGLDVARSLDGDKTTLAAGGRGGLRDMIRWNFNDTMYHVEHVIDLARKRYQIDLRKGHHPITVDMDGLGAGVGDGLRREGCWVIEFRGNSSSAVDPRTYGNLRAEAYAILARRLDPNDLWGNEPFPFPSDESLRQELCAPERIYKGGDGLRFHITPKVAPPGVDMPTIRSIIGRSPDSADAFVYFFNSVRILHSMNEFFARSSRPLVVYPSVPTGNPEPKVEMTTDTGKYLEKEYGGKTPPKPPEDWSRFFASKIAKNKESKEAENEEPLPASPAKLPQWMQNVNWSDE